MCPALAPHWTRVRPRLAGPPSAPSGGYESGSSRIHHAGFFDPGFGYERPGERDGSRAALAHDVPFTIEHGQRVCKLSFERMAEEPEVLYGEAIGSSDQGQTDSLGNHFRRPTP
jgi:dCTP deaminase